MPASRGCDEIVTSLRVAAIPRVHEALAYLGSSDRITSRSALRVVGR
jgi:hypothetical protein